MADTKCIKAQYAGGLLGVSTDDTHFHYFMEFRSSLFPSFKSSNTWLSSWSFCLHSMVVDIMLHSRDSTPDQIYMDMLDWATMGGDDDGWHHGAC